MTVSGTENYTTAYTYDNNNRLLTEAKAEDGTTVTTTYTYDANGNTLTVSTPANGENEAVTKTYTYNRFNQQIGLLTNNLPTAQYTYNAQGIRTGKTVGTEQTSFLLDGGNVVAEIQGESTTSYLRGVNLISKTTDTTEYYLFNAHGDVVNLTNATGATTKSYDYDAFGNERNPDEADTNPFRYCGEYWDTETGTYYLRARYYDPLLGRFMTEDPILDGLNWYTYCENNPVWRIDPSGLKDYIYTSAEEFYVENDWGLLDFLHEDRYFIEIDGVRYQANSIETIRLFNWISIDLAFEDGTFKELIRKAEEIDTDFWRIWEESIDGDLDFKLQLEDGVIYLINGKLYNRYEAGNFVWAYFLEKHGYSGYFSGLLAQGGSLLPPLLTGDGHARFDESWDRKARWDGIKYYYASNNSLWKYYFIYFIRFRFPHI